MHICDALRDLVTFVQFKNLKNTHGGVLLKLQKCYQILQSFLFHKEL